MERSVLEMLSDRSSAPTLLGCRPSARKSLGRSQKRFQLLTKSSFCSLHHDNNHSFKANSLLNLSCPRRYVGSGPDTMIVVHSLAWVNWSSDYRFVIWTFHWDDIPPKQAQGNKVVILWLWASSLQEHHWVEHTNAQQGYGWFGSRPSFFSFSYASVIAKQYFSTKFEYAL